MPVDSLARLLALLALISGGLFGCVLLGDRLLGVRVAVVTPSNTPVGDCLLSLVSAPGGKLIQQQEITHVDPRYGFINPPLRGRYYMSIGCPGRQEVFRSSVFDFAGPPYTHDFGEIVVDSKQ